MSSFKIRKYKIYLSYKKFNKNRRNYVGNSLEMMQTIEVLKVYCRKILDEIDHELNPKYNHFDKISSELSDYILSFQNKNCVKCDSVISGLQELEFL